MESVSIAARAFMAAVEEASAGMTEREFASRIEYAARTGGCDFASIIPPIVTSGIRTSMPHAVPTDKKFEWGDLVVVDFCVRCDGYVCDVTRMLSIGEPAQEIARFYSIVQWAQAEAAALLIPGRPVREVDEAARNVMKGAGLDSLFTHGLGHGIGVSVHEMPSINQLSGSRLAEGDVITLEPGFYKPGWCGMRVEDDYLITGDGASKLTEEFGSGFFVVG
jgi:Xaa-Pro aminopeptidase